MCYLAESNPFSEIAVEGDRVTVTSTSGVSITVSVETPERADHLSGSTQGKPHRGG
ncbi:hypothetical protein [Actinokineospora alba]|uniref:hypothetical protein n=1 Tax=Actinokineospora alba TaxID=504798 RepID=UPI001415264A|nr:hypothetical protein [Actinokineospora alba]